MRFLTTAILITALSACAHYGRNFDENKLADLRSGMTVDQVSAAISGKPGIVTHAANGNTVYTWQFSEAAPFSGPTAKLAMIVFGPDGRMIRVASSTVAK